MSLYELTRDLHHACERHPLGARMAQGAVRPDEWADWLWAFRTLHQVADRVVTHQMRREALLTADLALLPPAAPSAAALAFASRLCGQVPVGAAYVLHGAHRSGGRAMAPLLSAAGLPCLHIAYPDAAAAQDWVRWARAKEEFAPQARETFDCLLSVMTEIEERRK